jgi:hypothetical protein
MKWKIVCTLVMVLPTKSSTTDLAFIKFVQDGSQNSIADNYWLTLVLFLSCFIMFCVLLFYYLICYYFRVMLLSSLFYNSVHDFTVFNIICSCVRITTALTIHMCTCTHIFFCPVVTFETIQNNMQLHINTREDYKMCVTDKMECMVVLLK